MTDSNEMIDVLDARVARRNGRRDFFKAMGTAAAVTGGIGLAMKGSPLKAQAAITDADILNFALNLEYLEAQFYYYASFGEGLPAVDLTGTGDQGAAVGGRRAQFSDVAVARYAREIAIDEIAHVRFLRAALGTAAVAQPAINISGEADGAFTAAARAAGVVGPNATFDPYASDENFLLGAYIFEDVGVTAYKGASPLLTNKTFLEAAAGILAVEAYHAAIVRTTLYAKGIGTPSLGLIEATEAISDARDSLDGTGAGMDVDQGVAFTDTDDGRVSNIVPLDENGLAYSRSAGQVLNIVYLNSAAVEGGGFFPNGVNGTIAMSANNAPAS